MKIATCYIFFLALWAPASWSLTDRSPMKPPLQKQLETSFAKLAKKFQDCCSGLTTHNIAPEEALALMKREDVVFIDERAAEEQNVSMIKGAIRTQAFQPKAADKKKTYIVYCTIGYRSGKQTNALRKQGLRAFNLQGGIYGWTFFDGPIVDAKGLDTKKVHVYSDDWNFLRPDYTPVK